ncbi:MAG: DUF359 domain-containing protein [Candidatus Micrarchaeia archaeon]
MLILPEKLREEVRKPFGKIYKGASVLPVCKEAERPLITVGDQCAHDLITAGIVPDMLILDFKIKRVEIPKEMKKEIAPHAKNAFVVFSPPGRISSQLAEAVGMLLSEGSGAIIVIGEDDLSSLLVMAHAKIGTLVYGQPDEGAVVVPLGTPEIQKKAMDFLELMEEPD